MGPWMLLGLGLLTAEIGLDEMRRAVDRAFTAELAGDLSGAEAELEQILASSELTGSARIRAETYLDNLARRQAAFSEHGLTRQGFAEAFRTLRDGPHRWSDLMWRRATEHLPELEARAAARTVRVRSRRVRGGDAVEVDRFVVEGLRRRGLEVAGASSADFDLRFDLDASEVREDRHRHRARAEGSYILRSTEADRHVLGAGAEEHETRRPDPDAARWWASRRVLDELVDRIAFDLRLALLSRPR